MVCSELLPSSDDAGWGARPRLVQALLHPASVGPPDRHAHVFVQTQGARPRVGRDSALPSAKGPVTPEALLQERPAEALSPVRPFHRDLLDPALDIRPVVISDRRPHYAGAVIDKNHQLGRHLVQSGGDPVIESHGFTR